MRLNHAAPLSVQSCPYLRGAAEAVCRFSHLHSFTVKNLRFAARTRTKEDAMSCWKVEPLRDRHLVRAGKRPAFAISGLK